MKVWFGLLPVARGTSRGSRPGAPTWHPAAVPRASVEASWGHDGFLGG